MKQLPNKSKAETIRVVLDEAEMHRMLDPILKEVNSLRARVAELESGMTSAVKFANLTAEVQKETNDLLTVLVLDYKDRQDDGK